MANVTADFLDGLDHDLDCKVHAPKAKVTFDCDLCSGTGQVEKTYGYSYATQRTYVNKCKACQGRGTFTTSADVRARNRATATARKAAKLEDLQAAFHEANPDLIADLTPCGEWSEFARSLLDQFSTRGTLSEKQTLAALNMVAKVAENAAKRTKEKEAAQVTIDLTPIIAAFALAYEAGHNRPTYRAEGLTLSRAPDHGRNAGAIYVKDGHEYAGKIVAGVFLSVRDAAQDVAQRLLTIAIDPKEAAIRYGRKTGSCSCCGRELTRADSRKSVV